MRRRDFVALAGAAAAFPRVALAQQAAKLPMIGYLSGNNEASDTVADYQRGLAEAGFVDGRNVSIEYRWTDGDNAKTLPFMNDLIQRRVSVLSLRGILGSASASGEVFKALIASGIPAISGFARDPRRDGLVDSLSRPGGNLTGINQQTQELGPKRLNLLCDLVPSARTVGYLTRPSNPVTPSLVADLQMAAQALGLRLVVFSADTVAEIDAAFASLKANPIDAFICADAFFNTNRAQVVGLVTEARIPAIGEWREFAANGFLLSYGTSVGATAHQIGALTAAVLKGAKISDLPVEQNSSYEFVINLTTAKALGITIPPLIFAQATELVQ